MAVKIQVRKKPASKSGQNAQGLAGSEAKKQRQQEEKESMDVLEFIQAVDRYKRLSQKAFPPWSEILKILKSLGYRKIVK